MSYSVILIVILIVEHVQLILFVSLHLQLIKKMYETEKSLRSNLRLEYQI